MDGSFTFAAAVLHTKARQHAWQGEGPLSLKSFAQGEAHYQVGGARYLVTPDRYLLLNQRQEYQIVD